MNDQSNEWAWWQNALAGVFGPIHDGHPAQGFYRTGKDPVAIWRDAGGAMVALRAGKTVDANEVWTWACRKPISHELYTAVVGGGSWPEEIGELVAAAAPVATIGHNSATPEDEARDEIATLDKAFADWLASIGGTISTEEQDAKADTFQKRFAELAKKLDGIRDGMKRPFLEKGREIDAAWKPIIQKADDGKRTVGAVVTPYRVERQRIRDAEEAARKAAERAAREAAAEAERAAIMAGRPAPPPPPAPVAPVQPVRKQASGLRTYRLTTIDDLAAVVGEIMKIKQPPAEFVDVVTLIARRMMDAGIQVPGARIVEQKRA